MALANRSLKPYPPVDVAIVDTSEGSSVDADATAFLTATGITDDTIEEAIDVLVKDMKTAGIWTKFKAVYPFVGGTAATHKWNLKDPRDLDAAFRIVWAGTVTHNANGVTGNGTTGCGDTKLNGSSQSLNDNSHLGIYVRSATTNTGIGAYNGSLANWAIRVPGSIDIRSYTTTGTGRMSVADTPTGFLMESRRAAADGEAYKNGVSIATTGNGSENIPNANVFVLSRDAVSQFSDANLAFADIGPGLTDTEAANFYTAVQRFQTSLSREVGTPIVGGGSGSGLSGEVAISWKTRNRLTSGIKKQSESSDTVEDGQDTVIRFYASDGSTLLHTETLSAGEESFDYTAADEAADAGALQNPLYVKIKSVREGYESAEQTFVITR